MTASAIIRAGPTEPCRPWPRHVLAPSDWADMAAALPTEPGLDLLALWADTLRAHALFQSEAEILPVSVPVHDGCYPALSPYRPAAAWFERMVHDLWGHAATGGRDPRPWLDHGTWPTRAPLAPRPPPLTGPAEPFEFLPFDGEDMHQVPLGPVQAGIGEAGEFRITAQGETVLRLELRLGYLHKGTLALMRGKSPRAAARFAARLSGDSTVAHSIAFAHAAEAASGLVPPPRAIALRAVMAELERLANHAGDVAATLEAAGCSALPARFMAQRERLLGAASAAFGHRLMMDCVVPGGVAVDIAPYGDQAIADAVSPIEAELPVLRRDYEAASVRADRLAGVGVVAAREARAFAAGGVVGRAAGRPVDARRSPGYPPYQSLDFTVPTLPAGDIDARLRIRLAEMQQTAALLRQILPALPDGTLSLALPMASGEGIGWAEGFRGDIWHWLRLDGGQIAAAFPRDPSWLHWPLLEAAMRGGELADFLPCRASFNCSCAGVDL